MSEPVPAPSAPGFPPDEPRLASPAEDALLGGPAEPSDDTPTIISKNPPRPPAPAEDLFASGFRGRRLAHFELIEPIGVGGMAAVLRARDTQLDRCVALKILPPDMAQDAENVRRFHQEARSAAKLDHENIARVFFCGEDQRLHFIAFEFVEGDNLRTILERRGRLPVGEALHYMLQVAAGLAHAARRGVVHRDIKPSNIIITPNGRAKLVDMGLARSLAPHSEHDLTQSGVTLGTFDYISPEQALEPRDADVRSDIYSLGCTFYHMLTGHPPVPEGTALKKLHHHQHVKPPDPRQFVPDLPNEVAYILDRMMAKQVKDRYQTPEQLVHHLLLAARKLGAVGEVPEGVLSVEAALPNPPRSRPLLLAVLAAAAVVALVFFLDQPPGPQPRTPDPSPGANSAGPKDDPRQVETNPFPRAEGVKPPLTETIVPPGKPKVAVFNSDRPTEAGLVAFLQENQECEELDINLSGDLDFTPRFHDREQGPIQGLILRNKKVRIRSRGDRPATVRLSYDSRPQGDDKGTRAVFTILGKESQVEGIRFVVDARESQTALAGLVFRGGGQHRVSRCTFLQARPSLNEKKPLASVLVEAPEGGKLALLLEACAFLGFRDLGERPASAGGADEWLLGKAAEGGQDAVLRRGPAQVQAVNCAFGPHAAAFRLEGPGPAGGDPNLEVSHCSVLATRPSAVFDFAADADARIKVEGSLIARLENAPFLAARGDARGAVLVRQPTGQGPLVTYQGQGNRYHNLDGYWSILDGTGEAGWEEFGKRLAAMDRMDAESSVLRVSPWKDPMVLEQWKDKPLEQFDGKAIAAVFQPDPSRAELAFGDSLAGVKGLAGVEYRLNPPDAVKPPAVRRTLYVEEGKLPDPENRVYPTLGHVLPLLRPGDRVLLRHNGEVKMGPVELNTQERSDVTIAPDEGFHPILTLTDKENVDVDTALFRVHDGKLTLENLEFRVRARKGFTALGVVSLVGDGQCLLKHCAVTLDRGDQSERLPAVAVLPDPGKVMKMVDMTPPQPREQVPRLVVENCFVRGEGDLVWVRACRAAKCEVSGSLVALTGSLLNVEAAREAPPAPPTLAVTLLRTTTYLQGPLLRVRIGKESKGLAMLQCQPDECLFVPAAAGERVLVRLEGPEGEDKALQGKVQWERGRNAYGTFNMMLDYQAPGDSAMPMTMAGGVDSWKKWSNDSMSSYGVRLPTLPPYDLSLIQVLPAHFSQFKPADDTSPTCGADLKAVATPREEPRPPAATP